MTLKVEELDTEAAGRSKPARRWGQLFVSTLAHGSILAALLFFNPSNPLPESKAVPVTLIAVNVNENDVEDSTGPAETEEPAASPAPPAQPKKAPKPNPVPVGVGKPPEPAGDPKGEGIAPMGVVSPTIPSDALLSGARVAGGGQGMGAGSGGGRGQCDMVDFLEKRLRKSASVQAVVRKAHDAGWAQGKPIWVWNGDWIQTPGEAGNGLAVLREAMAWEIGFAPQACRADPVQGMVVISLNDAPGSPRLAVGGGQWRWSDLPIAKGTKSAMAGTYR